MDAVEKDAFALSENILIFLKFASGGFRLLVEHKHDADQKGKKEIQEAAHHGEDLNELILDILSA